MNTETTTKQSHIDGDRLRELIIREMLLHGPSAYYTEQEA